MKKIKAKYYILVTIVILNIVALYIALYSTYDTAKKIPEETQNDIEVNINVEKE